MVDQTEGIRREMIADQQVVAAVVPHDEIVGKIREEYPDACNTQELQEQYTVIGFGAPFVVVKRKSDGVKGSMEFMSSPRIYYNFSPA